MEESMSVYGNNCLITSILLPPQGASMEETLTALGAGKAQRGGGSERPGNQPLGPPAATTAPQCHVVDHVINDTSPLGPPPATTPASGRGGGKGDKGEMAHLDSLHQHSREHALLGKHPELPEDSGSGGGGCREAGSRRGSTGIENHSTPHTRAHTVLVGPATTTPSQKRAAMPKRSQSAATSREVPEILFHKSRKHRSKTEHKTLTRLASARRQ